MGAAHNQRGERALRRPFDEASERSRFAEDSLMMFAASERAVARCRDTNAALAEIAGHKGVRLAFAQVNLQSHVGQVRRDKYLAACNRWRAQLPGRREWCAALDMAKAADHLMAWVNA